MYNKEHKDIKIRIEYNIINFVSKYLLNICSVHITVLVTAIEMLDNLSGETEMIGIRYCTL